MIDKKYRRYAAAGIVAALILAFGALSLSGEREGRTGNFTDWKEVPLTDVSSGEKYTVEELEKPVLVETFAVWCPTCTRQQREVGKLHQDIDVTSVSLDVDPNEDEEKIRQHLERHGFSWRYSVSPPEATNLLRKEYGNVIITPPRAPMVLVCEEGERLLSTGVKPSSRLQQEIERGC